MNLYKRVANIWFEGIQKGKPIPSSQSRKWFSSEFDHVSKGFVPDIENHIKEGFKRDKVSNAKDALGLIILLDQFSRNSWRGNDASFVYTKVDPLAQTYSKHFIEEKYDDELESIEKIWLYFPLMHSEDIKSHELALKKFQEADEKSNFQDDFFKGFVEFEIKHKNLIDRFGRYPYRNNVLGRESTKEEKEYLESGGDDFANQKK